MLYNLTQIASCSKTRRKIISVSIFLTFVEFNMQELYRNFQNMYSRVPLVGRLLAIYHGTCQLSERFVISKLIEWFAYAQSTLKVRIIITDRRGCVIFCTYCYLFSHVKGLMNILLSEFAILSNLVNYRDPSCRIKLFKF